MTFGEKIRSYRTKKGMTQGELAEKLSVSRQAITKWEADRGVPDIENLVAIARLFGVSVDFLLNDTQEGTPVILREEININDYKKEGACRSKYDAVVKHKYQAAKRIYPLIRNKKLNRVESILDFVIQPGVFHVADSLSDMTTYYLVEMEHHSLLVHVTKTYIESEELITPFEGKKCVIGHNVFQKMNYML